MDLLSLDNQYVWHPFTPLINEPPIVVEKARGMYLYTQEGRKIMDAISSWWVNIHGHCNEYIAQAISRQAFEAEHLIFAGFTHEPAITLAKRLLEILPGGMEKLFYSDDGSTAVEVGIKMALQFWHNRGVPKRKIIAIEGGYHGDTFGGMSVAERGPFTAPFQSHLFDVDFIPFPEHDNIEDVLNLFQKYTEKKDVAAFIYEPLLQGAAGMRMYKPEQLETLIALAKANDVICIADEVLTGFGRTGKNFASEHLNVFPDIMCLSKGITGGFMAMGATTCSNKIIEAFNFADKSKVFYHGHSYTANPMACAAANASLDLLLASTCQDEISRIAQRHRTFIKGFRITDKVKNIRNIGTVLAIELNDQEQTSYFNPLRKRIYAHFLSKNILLRPLGNVFYILPPYIITDGELDLVYKEIEGFLDEL